VHFIVDFTCWLCQAIKDGKETVPSRLTSRGKAWGQYEIYLQNLLEPYEEGFPWTYVRCREGANSFRANLRIRLIGRATARAAKKQKTFTVGERVSPMISGMDRASKRKQPIRLLHVLFVASWCDSPGHEVRPSAFVKFDLPFDSKRIKCIPPTKLLFQRRPKKQCFPRLTQTMFKNH
jgi:hypothetical protein